LTSVDFGWRSRSYYSGRYREEFTYTPGGLVATETLSWT
jgi:hypothetical protein